VAGTEGAAAADGRSTEKRNKSKNDEVQKAMMGVLVVEFSRVRGARVQDRENANEGVVW
jgi:hypothetical protein